MNIRKVRGLMKGPADLKKMDEIEAAWSAHYATMRADHSFSMCPIRRVWLNRHLVNQRGRCAYCNVLMSVDRSSVKQDCRATIDHVVARARGGQDIEGNTVAACAACNSAKADLSKEAFYRHPVRLKRLQEANTPPDRLALDPTSPFYNDDALTRGVGLRFRECARDDVYEYCVSEGWVKVRAGKTFDKRGWPVTVKLSGPVDVIFLDL